MRFAQDASGKTLTGGRHILKATQLCVCVADIGFAADGFNNMGGLCSTQDKCQFWLCGMQTQVVQEEGHVYIADTSCLSGLSQVKGASGGNAISHKKWV